MSYVGAIRGEHVHAVRRNRTDPDARGYEVIGWDRRDDGTVEIRMLDVDGTETTYAELEVPMRQGGRRLYVVPWPSSERCCDLTDRRRRGYHN